LCSVFSPFTAIIWTFIGYAILVLFLSLKLGDYLDRTSTSIRSP
jgi:hypothetical protein